MNSNVTGHGLIDYIVVFLFCMYAFWCGAKKSVNILYIIAASASYWFFVDYITMLTPIKLVPTCFLFGNFFGKNKNYIANAFKSVWIKSITVLLIFSFFLGLTYTFSFRTDLGYNPLQRIIIQTITNINLVLVYSIVFTECKENFAEKKFINGYLFFTTVLCVYGIYQFFAFQYGLPVRGIVYSAKKVGTAYDASLGLTRINSLGNEPKRLSYVLFLGFLFVISFWKKLQIRILYKYILLFIHLICSLLTFSTSLFTIIIIYVVIVFFMSLIKKNSTSYLSFLSILLILLGGFLFFNKGLAEKLIEGRLSEQAESLNEKTSDYVDPYAFELLQEDNSIFYTGVGPGNYNFILHEKKGKGISEYGLQVMDSAFLNNIYDFGLFGLLIFAMPFFCILFNLNKYKNQFTQQIEPLLFIFIFATCIFLIAWPIYFMMAAFFDATREKTNI